MVYTMTHEEYLAEEVAKEFIHVTDRGQRLHSFGGQYGVMLKVGIQEFNLHYYPDKIEEAEQMKKTLAKAIAKIVRTYT